MTNQTSFVGLGWIGGGGTEAHMIGPSQVEYLGVHYVLLVTVPRRDCCFLDKYSKQWFPLSRRFGIKLPDRYLKLLMKKVDRRTKCIAARMSGCNKRNEKTTYSLLGAYKSRPSILRPREIAMARKQFVLITARISSLSAVELRRIGFIAGKL